MRKKEDRLYKDGIKNVDGYKFSIFKTKEKIIIFIITFLFAIFSIILFLDNFNVISKNDFFNGEKKKNEKI